ncbi:PhzF family phenazine biosynthesis protein [Thermosynechococcaceae cyanobacterium BACA0444]|uniref:PhzF family phenazine biosynthesis protein n=1 Tax=Pseudocalidococcus azoricus BACA0444 TaxID=2918990 RepID=A0AAE4FRV7_9CYAN|nr:PhzF family phenazine biosynthesis protein [Pseudocalidococcus azoricus]MDS3860407.1 PhzF family phenazine biosynthesis protein [Pseudocalidococcus azoricus BACA0444]
MSAKIPLFQVNAFTDRPFSGNPAAVCLLHEDREPAWLQGVAAEMNLSETAFLLPQGQDFQLRWFTPTLEVDLCGHATLAAAHVLLNQNLVPADQPMTFHTRSGPLIARQVGNYLELDFPIQPIVPTELPELLIAGLGITGAKLKFLGKTPADYFIELDAETLRGLQPNFPTLAQVPGRGVIVTAKADVPEADFISRFFAPAAGIAEDPVTGSAHCSLYPYWSEKLDKKQLTGFQASGRGGWVKVRGEGERVVLGGQALLIWQGELVV